MHYKYAATKKEIDTDREKDLIAQYQLTEDPLVMKEILKLYQGLMRKAVQQSGIAPGIMTQDAAMNYAESYVKKYLKQYSAGSGALPSTYIYNNLDLKLRTLKADGSSQISGKPEYLQRYNSYGRAAQTWLDRMDMDTDISSTHNFIRNEFGKAPGRMDEKTLQRAFDLNRTEMSADQSFGNDPSADYLSFGEAIEPSVGMTGQDILTTTQQKSELKKILSGPGFTHAERKFVREWLGLDSVVDLNTKIWRDCVVNAGVSDAQAKAALERLKQKWHGVI